MPSNPRHHEMKCWDHLFYMITKLNKNNMPAQYDELVLQCIRKYPVGLKQVDVHLKRFYIERGIVELRPDGYLYPPDFDDRKKKDVEASVQAEIDNLGVPTQ